MINAGDSVHIQSGYNSNGEPVFHRFIALTPAHKNTKQIILVNFSTLRGRKNEDITTIFRVNEIDFLLKDSYIAYDGAILLTISELKAKIKEGTARLGNRGVSNDQLQKILAGIKSSGRAPIEVEEMYEYYIESLC